MFGELSFLAAATDIGLPLLYVSRFQQLRGQKVETDIVRLYCPLHKQGQRLRVDRRLEAYLNEGSTPEKRFEGCGFTIVPCPVSYAGCQVTLPRKDIPTHISESVLQHTIMQAKMQAGEASSFRKAIMIIVKDLVERIKNT